MFRIGLVGPRGEAGWVRGRKSVCKVGYLAGMCRKDRVGHMNL